MTRRPSPRSTPRTRPTTPSASPGNRPRVARIALDETRIRTEQGWTAVEPGMSVEAEIKTGRRRVIGYIVDPLVKYWSEGTVER